jgi:SnoaL-like domain
MQPSAELKAFYRRCCDAMSGGDGAFFASAFSQSEGVLAIGTDPAEWWNGYPTISRVFEAQLQETDGFKVVADNPLAWRNGPVGWVADRPMLKLPDGTEIPARLTAVFQQERDSWKIVQWHFSLGVPNEQVVGTPLTTA